MWTVSPVSARPFSPQILKPTKPPFPLIVVSANSLPQRHRAASTSSNKQQLQQHFKQKQGQEKQKEEEGGRVRQLNGLDVLWAMQKASRDKKNKKKRKKGSSSSAGSVKEREGDDVDYGNVKPLCVKTEWGVRLDELEKRLQELSETK